MTLVCESTSCTPLCSPRSPIETEDQERSGAKQE